MADYRICEILLDEILQEACGIMSLDKCLRSTERQVEDVTLMPEARPEEFINQNFLASSLVNNSEQLAEQVIGGKMHTDSAETN